MNRTEFLAALSLRLQDLSPDERDDAVTYYNEYLDEVGPDGEDAAIEELGGAEKVANIIRANCGAGPLPTRPAQPIKPNLTLDAPLYTSAPKAPPPDSAFAAAEEAEQRTGTNAQGTAQAQAANGGYVTGAPYAGGSTGNTNAQYNARNTRILWLIIIVCTFPIWIGLLGGLFGGSVGLLGALIAVLFSGFGVLVAAVVMFVCGITLLGSSFASGCATMGLALLCFALGAVLAAGCVWLLAKGVPLLFKLIGKAVSFITGKVGR